MCYPIVSVNFDLKTKIRSLKNYNFLLNFQCTKVLEQRNLLKKLKAALSSFNTNKVDFIYYSRDLSNN